MPSKTGPMASYLRKVTEGGGVGKEGELLLADGGKSSHRVLKPGRSE